MTAIETQDTAAEEAEAQERADALTPAEERTAAMRSRDSFKREDVDQLPDAELTRLAITVSGLTSTRFSERLLTRDSRTIRRWVSGDQDVPEIGRERMIWFLTLRPAARARLLGVLRAD